MKPFIKKMKPSLEGVILVIFILCIFLSPQIKKIFNTIPDKSVKPYTPKNLSYKSTGQIQYYDSSSHSLKKYFTHIIVATKTSDWKFRVIGFLSPENKMIDSSLYLTGSQFNSDDVAEITMKNGSHYSILLLSIKDYKSQKQLDSIKKVNKL
jgi:hypothetical protein